MDNDELMKIVSWLHPKVNGFRRMRYTHRSRHRKGDFRFTFLGETDGGTLYASAAADMIQDGWCEIMALDADTEYLTMTELGSLLVAELDK